MRPTVGVEEELLLVDPQSGRAVPGFDDLAAAARRRPAAVGLVEHEFKREQAEIASAPFADVEAVRADLTGRRAVLRAVAANAGLGVAALASSPLAVHPTPTADERYQTMDVRFGLLADRQLTCGAHVHVAVPSRAEGVAVLDRLRPWLAPVLALSANSPFWNGQDSGYASYRSIVWSQWPTAGPYGRFGDLAGYEAAIEALLASQTVLDIGMVYFDARLSARYPTVEVRVADVCHDVADTATVAGLVRALVVTAAEHARAGRAPSDVRTEILRLAAWRAARSGIADDLLDVDNFRPHPAADVLDRLLDLIRPALRECGDDALVHDGVARILRRGNGAARQRVVAGAALDLSAVVLDAASPSAQTS